MNLQDFNLISNTKFTFWLSDIQIVTFIYYCDNFDREIYV